MVANDASDAPPVRDNEYALTALLSTDEDGTRVCTIYPSHVGSAEQTTTWISAEGDAFVTIENYS